MIHSADAELIGSTSSPEVNLPMSKYREELVESIDKSVADSIALTPERFQERHSYFLLAKSSRLRPLMVMIVGDTLGMPRHALDTFVISMDRVHSSSLVIDDLPCQDDADLRRGQPAMHIKFQEGPALIDAVVMLAETIKFGTKIEAKDKDIQGKLIPYLAQAVIDMCVGQDRDKGLEKKSVEEVTVKELDEIAFLKTSKAIEMAVKGAAIIGKSSKDVIKVLESYSEHLGITYQVKDDVADATRPEEETGKTANLDAENGKPTYIDLLGEKGAQTKAQAHADKALGAIERLPRQYNPRKLQEVVAMVLAK